jgi:hypothetical protein
MAIEPGTVLFSVNRLINGSRIPGLPHKAKILRNRDQIAVHPEARDLDLVGKEFASYPCVFFQPVVIPIIPVPEAADFIWITSHDKGASRNPNQLSARQQDRCSFPRNQLDARHGVPFSRSLHLPSCGNTCIMWRPLK